MKNVTICVILSEETKFQNKKAKRTICVIQACPANMEEKKHFIEIIDLHVLEIKWQKHVTTELCDPCFRATLSVLSCNLFKVM